MAFILKFVLLFKCMYNIHTFVQQNKLIIILLIINYS